MKLMQLLQFKAIAEHGQIARAAEEMYVSPPAMSKALRKLENELDTTLFERTKEGLVLNVAGEMVLETTDKICELIGEMRRDAENMQ